MNATESLLTLLRAARDFTRRAVGAEEIERAAIAHAEALGWHPPEKSAVCTREQKRRDERIAEIEGALRSVLDAADASFPPEGAPTFWGAWEHARKVLG